MKIMSLIVARKYNNNLIIVSDTKLTYDDHKERNSPKEGTIKVIILSSKIAICYAGKVCFAELALKEIAEKTDVSIIESILLKYHNESKQETDFLLAFAAENLVLVEIKNGTSLRNDNCWIGTIEGFNKYQSIFLSENNNKPQELEVTTIKIVRMPDTDDNSFRKTFSKMYDAMLGVIEGHEVKDVGGFIIPLIFENDEFHYSNYTQVFRKPIDVDLEMPDGKPTNINFSSVEDGAYIVNFFGGKTKELAIHFPHGNIGVHYTRKENGLLNPKVYTEMDEIDFTEFLESHSTVKFGISMFKEAGNYALKAEKEFNEGRYDAALRRVNQAINQASKSWGPEPDHNASFNSLQECLDAKGKIEISHEHLETLENIFILKGEIFFVLGDFNKAILSFREAITLKENSFEGLRLKGMAQANLGRFQDALETLTECVKHHENAEIYYSRGVVYYHKGDYISAKKDFEMALVIDNKHVKSKQALHDTNRIIG